MPTVKDIYQLPKASRYANPRNGADPLRLVWGDMTTGGVGGLWQMPCIDTVNRVYALAGHAVLSLAGGNSITVYNKDGQALSGYTFNESNDYESLGAVATVSFPTKTATTISFDASTNSIKDSAAGLAVLTNCMVTASGAADSENNQTFKIITATASEWVLDGERKVKTAAAGPSITLAADQQQSEPLTARAKGRASGGSLITNPIGVAEDFLLNFAQFTSDDLEATALERARQVCAIQAYAAAGVLGADQAIGQTLSEMLACFLGSWRRWPTGQIMFVIERGTGSWSEGQSVGIIRSWETANAEVSQDSINLCNQAAVDYCYNQATGQYEAHDDGSATCDAKSQSLFGVQARAFSWPWVRSSSVVATVQALIVAAFKRPALMLSVNQAGFANLPAVPGDYILASVAWLMDANGQPLINQYFQVLRMEPNLDEPGIAFSLLDTGVFKALRYLADGSVLAGGAISGSLRNMVET
ncbi:MAG: hypothetical protein HY794_15755 [Desulfarculus sp.]|nr:hypothetical protein [Desulfarculus sp.]